MKRDSSESGSILLLSMLVAMVLTAIGVTSAWLSTGGTQLSSNISRRQEALFAAEAGIERARRILDVAPNLRNMLVGDACDAQSDDLDGKGVVLCNVTDAMEDVSVIDKDSVTAQQAGAANQMRFTVWIRNDPNEYRWCNGIKDTGEDTGEDTGQCETNAGGVPTPLGDPEDDEWRRVNDSDGRIIIHSEGTARDGLSTVVIETIYLKSAGGGGATESEYSQAQMGPLGSSSGVVAMDRPGS